MNRFRILSAAFFMIAALVFGVYAIEHPEFAEKINDFVGYSIFSSGISGSDQEASGVSKDDQIVKVIVIFLIFGFIAFMAIMSAIDWMLNMRKLAKKNSVTLDRCRVKKNDLDKKYLDIKYLLRVLQRENPPEIWKNLKVNFDNVDLGDVWKDYRDTASSHRKGLFFANQTKGMLSALEKQLTEYLQYYGDIEKIAQKMDLEKAKHSVLLRSLPMLAAETKIIIRQKNVAVETVRAFVRTNKELNAILSETKSAVSDTNWADMHNRLINIKIDFISVQNSAKHDIEKADMAMKDGPILMKNMPERILSLECELFSLRAKDLLEEAKSLFGTAQAQANNGSKLKNWIQIYLQVIEANDLLVHAQAVNKGTLSIDDSYGKAADMDNVTLIAVAGGEVWQPGAATI